MLATSLRTFRARYHGCIALCNDSVWAAHNAFQGGEQQDKHGEHASMCYATLAATLTCQPTRNASFGHSHRTFFSWGSGTPAKPAADAVLDNPDSPATDAAPPSNDMFDASQIVDVAAMAETHALQAAAEGAWPNTVLAQQLIELLHSGAGLGWCAPAV